MYVYLDIDGCVLYHRVHYGRPVLDQDAPTGWSGQLLCHSAPVFFDTVKNRGHKLHWLGAWTQHGKKERIRAQLLPHLPSATSVSSVRWRRTRAEAINLQDPWLWISGTDLTTEEQQHLQDQHYSLARVDPKRGTWIYQKIDAFAPSAVLITSSTCATNLQIARDFVLHQEEIIRDLEESFRRPPSVPIIRFRIDRIGN